MIRLDEPIQTDALRYVAIRQRGEGPYTIYGFKVVATFENRTGRDVYLGRCDTTDDTPIFGVPFSGGDPMDSAYERFWGCGGQDAQLLVAPGQSRTDTILIEGPNGWDGRTKVARGQLEGRFRIAYDAQYCPADCLELVPEADRVSNEFDVVVAR